MTMVDTFAASPSRPSSGRRSVPDHAGGFARTMSWLMRNGDVLAAAEVATGRRARRRGLLGRDSVEGVLVLRPGKQVHTVRMRFPIDVAFVDKDGRVLRAATLPPWRVSRPVPKSAYVIEASAGAFDRWRLKVDDVVEIRE